MTTLATAEIQVNGSHPDEFNKFKVLKSTDQIKELQTIIRDKETSRSDFKFVADRLIRMVIEEGLNQLPYQDCEVCLQLSINEKI